MLSALSACASIRTSSRTPLDARLGEPGRYAWRASEPATQPHASEVNEEGALVDDGELVARAQAAADGEFAARGFVLGELWDSKYHAVLRPRIRMQTESRDPYFSGSVAARYEEGTLRVDLYDGATGVLVWSGAGTSRLRDAALGYGVNTVRFAETEAERDWRVDEKVGAIFEHFPLPVVR